MILVVIIPVLVSISSQHYTLFSPNVDTVVYLQIIFQKEKTVFS